MGQQRPGPGRPGPGTQGRQGGGSAPPPPPTALTREEVKRIFAPDGYLAVNELGKRLGDTLANRRIGRSQVRNILNSFQVIAETWDATDVAERGRQIARLKPNLIYLAARDTNRDKKDLLTGLADTLGYGIDAVLEQGSPNQQRYTALVDLVEAITAYHRAKSNTE